MPALLAFVLVTSLLICLFNPSPQLALRTGVTSLFGFSNVYLLQQATDYFAQSTELNPFTHTWSLGVEEQFYLLFPFLIWFSGYGRQAKNGARNLFVLIAGLAVASLLAFVVLYPRNQPAAYFLMPPRFWEMAAGCLVFIGYNKRAIIEEALGRVPPLLVLAAMVGVMDLPLGAAVPATIAIVALSAILLAGLKRGTAAHHLFTNKRVVFVGLISYSLYLWHWGVLSISRWSIGITRQSTPVLIVLMAALAIFSYECIEKPLRGQPWDPKRYLTILRGALVLLLAAVGIQVLSKRNAGLLSIGNSLTGPQRILDTGIVQKGMYCHLPKRSQTAIADCLGGGNVANRAIYILGDSHASNHFPSIQAAASALPTPVQVKVLVDWGLINWLYGVNNCMGLQPCIEDAWPKHRDFFRQALKPGDVVVFSWFRERVVEKSRHLPRKPDRDRLSILSSRLNTLASSVLASGGKLVLVDDIPMVCEPGINYQHFVLRIGQWDKCVVSERASLEDRAGLTALLKDLAFLHPGKVVYFGPHSFLCSGGVCDIFDRRNHSHSPRVLYGDGLGRFQPEYPNPLVNEWKNFLVRLQ